MKHLMKSLFAVAALALTAVAQPAVAQDTTLTVFAAASLKNALDDVNAAFAKKSHIKVNTSYAASSALARQIESGAPADVFLSADLKWMDYVAGKNLIKADTRFNMLGNKLVLIAGKDSKLSSVTISQGFDIAKLAGSGRIAIADTKAVPAGLYAKAALEKLGAWTAAEPKLAQGENVRATLAFVARGETPVGIVYATDAKIEPSVTIVGIFPDDSYPPVTYPVAATVNAKPGVSKYLAFLKSSTAKAIFEKYGFSYLIKPVS
ncbi:MAG: Molybdenum ABC transporter, substrate-binding protein ModA [Pseudolabrys sp.]|jgi:molybdate transport system substrate-binding protein|nr:Molybdenum ABC transporter, substrate-binding protein ModA [Pseudolabrys sp.]